MIKRKYIAAMSGGVDSSVAAHMILSEGHDVVGVTLRMKHDINEEEDNQVMLVARKLGIEHHFLDVRNDFREKVLKYSFDEYLRGRTPNPCVMCNLNIKFGLLMDYAVKLGGDGIITGHYARIIRSDDGKARVFKGIDDNKNQTYFLAMLSQRQIDFSYMPLGAMTKIKVREIAAGLCLPNARKAESQDVCVGISGTSFPATMSGMFGHKGRQGNVVTESGKVVGTHEGIHNFTIGQRKGLGVALGEPAYVKAVDPESNTVVVSTDENSLLCSKFTASGMNWLDFSGEDFSGEIQTRYRQRSSRALVKKIDAGRAEVHMEQPLRAVTPGQTLAVYNGDQLIAGGWIDQAL